MRERRLIDDCFLTDAERLTHAEAIAILKSRVTPVAGTETVPLASALSRILAEPVASPRDVPASDNAAVDGYAFAHADFEATGGWFPVTARIAAGHPAAAPHLPASAARIFTGAVMPEGADTVAMQEDCEAHEQDGVDFVAIPPGLKAGANRRRAGEDVAAGMILAGPGTLLRPQEIAAIASTGRDAVQVFAPLSVAIVSTGDELARPGSDLPPGGVYDSNHYLLAALLAANGIAAKDAGILPDRAEIVRDTLAGLASRHDLVLTTGGASRGEEDHLVEAMDALGRRHLWQLAIKPGRPMSFGQIDGCPVLALPGNPVAAFVCFLLYVRPMLRVLGGGHWPEPQRFRVAAAFDLAKKKTGRREFLRGRLVAGPDGTVAVEKFERDGSGLITSLREADGLIEIGEDVASVAAGTSVDFLPFSGMGLAV